MKVPAERALPDPPAPSSSPRWIEAPRMAPSPRGAKVPRAAGLGAAFVILLGIYVGSRGLRDFDTALVSYAAATVFAAFGVGYRYAIWLARPPTRLYFRRGIALLLEPRRLPGSLARLTRTAVDNLLLQRFIRRRSKLRWLSHACLSWGCMLAAAVTFPLSFGWVRFESTRSAQEIYEAYVFGVRVARFPAYSILGELVFNVLVIAAALVITGVMLALIRRARDRGELAIQDGEDDLLPLLLLFAISSTGVLLTISSRFLHGFHYAFLSQLHAVTVIFTLLYLPFGKFFHIFQRPTQITIDLYRREAAAGEQARCGRCGEPFASKLQIEDLKSVESSLGVRYGSADGTHYQDICPPCRRKNLALIQDGLTRAARRGDGGYA